MIRRFEAVLLGIVLLLCGAVSHSTWEPHHYPWMRPDVELAPRRPWIALTFDDGPNPYYTSQVMAVLQHYRIKATFFCVGRQVAKYPDLVE